MRIPKGDQAQRDRAYASRRLREIEHELEELARKYHAALACRDNQAMDEIAQRMRLLREEAEKMRRIAIVGYSRCSQLRGFYDYWNGRPPRIRVLGAATRTRY